MLVRIDLGLSVGVSMFGLVVLQLEARASEVAMVRSEWFWVMDFEVMVLRESESSAEVCTEGLADLMLGNEDLEIKPGFLTDESHSLDQVSLC